MRKVGITTTLLVVAVMVGGVYLGIRSWPDIKRYLRIRQM